MFRDVLTWVIQIDDIVGKDDVSDTAGKGKLLKTSIRTNDDSMKINVEKMYFKENKRRMSSILNLTNGSKMLNITSLRCVQTLIRSLCL